MNFEKLLEQEAQRAALQDYEEVTEKTKNYSYKFSKEFIQKMNKMIYEEKRKAKKKRRLRFLLVAAVILILNTSGYAYLYQLPDGKRLLPKIYLKQSDIWSEQIIWEGDFCWYPSFRKGIYRLNTRTGEVELVVKIKGENVTHIVQDKNNILVFTSPKTKNIYKQREKVIRYSYRIEKDGELKYQYRKQEEDYCKICFIIEDVNKKKVIVATSSKKRVEGDSLLYCSDGHLLNIPVNNRWKQGEWWYNRELQISEQDNRMIYVDEHGYLCITELYAENIIKRNRLDKYVYDILYIPTKGVLILTDDGVYEMREA